MKGIHVAIHLCYIMFITNVNSAKKPANIGNKLQDCDLSCEDFTRKIKFLEDNFAVMRRAIIDLVKQNKKMSNLENFIEIKLENISSNFEKETEVLRHKLEEEVQNRRNLQDMVETLQERLNQTHSQLLESKGTERSNLEDTGDTRDVPKITEKIAGSCYLQDLPEREGVDLKRNEQVNSNEKADIVCHKGYILKYPYVYCLLGEWLTENNLSPCQKSDILPKSCSLRDLPEKDGVDLTEDKLVNSDKRADIVCHTGYSLTFPNVYCIRGKWLTENDLSPCQPESCTLGDLPEKEGVDLTEDKVVNSDERADILCEEGYSLAFPNVYCIRGKWRTENDVSPCQAQNCSLRDLPENDGMELTEDEVVNSDEKANIVCKKGYSLAFSNVYCKRGKWLTENGLSPCQEDGCEVQLIKNAEIRKEIIPLLNIKLGLQQGGKSEYLKVDIGSLQNSGDSLFVNCIDGYGFADENVVHIKITCNKGQWTAFPECALLPTCYMGDLHDHLPEGVVPYVGEGMSEDIPSGRGVKLGCYRNEMVLKGDIFANCSADGEWKVGNNLQCAQGCASYERRPDSELLLHPEKQFYDIGDSILFSCAKGKVLTKRVDRVQCTKQGWAPNVKPECLIN